MGGYSAPAYGRAGPNRGSMSPALNADGSLSHNNADGINQSGHSSSDGGGVGAAVGVGVGVLGVAAMSGMALVVRRRNRAGETAATAGDATPLTPAVGSTTTPASL